MNLYYLETVVNGFEYRGIKYNNLPITWHISKRPEHMAVLWNFPALIQDYEKQDKYSRMYCEDFITEHFTELEKEELFPEIISNVKESFEVVSVNVIKAELPAPSDVAGLGAVGYGGGIDCWGATHEETGYQLHGYYDVRPFWEEPEKKENISEPTNKLLWNLGAAVDALEAAAISSSLPTAKGNITYAKALISEAIDEIGITF